MISQSRMILSSDPDAITFESGLHAIVDIPAMCPSNVCKMAPVSAFQILMVLSAATPTNQLAFLSLRVPYAPTATCYPLAIRRELGSCDSSLVASQSHMQDIVQPPWSLDRSWFCVHPLLLAVLLRRMECIAGNIIIVCVVELRIACCVVLRRTDIL